MSLAMIIPSINQVDKFLYIVIVIGLSKNLPLQSFMVTIPKIWSRASDARTVSPKFVGGPPTKKATSNSKSIDFDGPKTGSFPSTGSV